MDFVILVDNSDNPIGQMEKLEAHQTGALHRAFSVFVFNSKKEILLHKRADSKYHCGGLWTNTCCSHQRPEESTLEAAKRRLKEEMGMQCDLKEIFSFTYQVEFKNGLIEHEYDHVLIGISDDKPEINLEEVSAFTYKSVEAIKEDLLTNEGNYTPWFKIAMDKLPQHIA
ncbi:MAG: isopentenyl-diphosphate Delta-isomerase [Bacteroidota bacterium]